jgi:hypothetical protein
MESSHRAKEEEFRQRLVTDPENELLEYRHQEQVKSALDHARLSAQYRRAAFFFWQTGPRDLPLPYPWDQDRDRRVLEAALLLELHESHTSNRRGPDEPPLNLVAVDECSALEPEQEFGLEELVSKNAFPTEMVADLKRRNRAVCESLAELKFDRRRVIVDDLQRLHEAVVPKYPDAQAFGKVALPGYSRDGRHALVVVQDMFNPHGASGVVCVLIKSGARWRVLWSYHQGHE